METNSEFLKEIRRQLASGNAETALELSRRALERWSDDEALICLLARSEEGLGRLAAARERLEGLVASSPDSVDPRFELGRLLVGLEQVTEAREHLRACISNDPGHAPAWTLLARLDRQAGKRSEAISGLKTALRADPDHVPALVSLAELLLEENDHDAANEHASRAIQLQPEKAASQLALARVFAAGGMHGFAQRCLANAVGLAPEDAQVRNTAGHLYQKMGRENAAAENLAAARSLGLDDPGNASAFAASLSRMGRIREALVVVDRIPPEKLSADLVRELAESALRSGQFAELDDIAELATGLQVLPEAIRIWTQALQAHARDQWDRAVDLVEQLIDSEDPELRVRARIQAARSHLRAERAEAAVSVLEPLVADKQLEPRAHWELAALFRQAGRPERAVETLRAVLERRGLDEDSATLTRARLVDLLDRDGRYDEAAGLLENAGWQPPYLGEPDYLEVDDEARQAVIRLGVADVDDSDGQAAGLPQVVFVTGWPCAGRDLIVPALAVNQEISALPPGDWPRRRQRLALPVDPSRHAGMEATELHRMRRAYLRGFSGRPIVLEPAVVQAFDLAHLARLFPTALVINPQADPRYLKTQWRLLGYRQVPSMIHAWQCEQEAMDMFRDSGALQVLDCPLDDLVEDPAAALADACRALGIGFRPLMSEAVAEAFARGGYRQPDHWRHYARPD